MAEKDQLLRRLDAAKEKQAATGSEHRDQTLLNLSVASYAEKEHAREEIKVRAEGRGFVIDQGTSHLRQWAVVMQTGGERVCCTACRSL